MKFTDKYEMVEDFVAIKLTFFVRLMEVAEFISLQLSRLMVMWHF